MSVTIRDVAKHAGVGVATVSRVLNRSDLVRPATRDVVVRSIAELNYAPNPTARRLSLGKMFTIGVISPFFTRYSYTERLRAIEHVASNLGYDIIVFNVESVERRDRYFHDVPRADRVDGVLIMSLAPTEEHAALFHASQVPVVLIDTTHPLLTSVCEDSVYGGHVATQHLIDLGHRHIGFVADRFENPYGFTSMRNRHTGYLQALHDAGIAVNPADTVLGEHGREAAREMARALLTRPDRPTAIVAASDTQAMGVLEAARQLGLRVPEDLSVIGYDDIEVAEYLGLTTMRQSLYESGKLGVELLMTRVNAPVQDWPAPAITRLPSELVRRATTAALFSQSQ
jgi:DNA-binding LacI/PurR family transcriptional regulator